VYKSWQQPQNLTPLISKRSLADSVTPAKNEDSLFLDRQRATEN
jgi:hypothetical protein